ERLGVELTRVQVDLGDSSLPPGPMAASSATTAGWCAVVLKGCDAIANQAGAGASLAAQFDRLRRERIEQYAEWIPRGLGPDTLKDLHRGGVNFYGGATDDGLMFAFGAQFVEVRIHALTREIRVPRMVGAFAAGRIVNERPGPSQLPGGMSWGASSALHEQTVIDRKRARYVNDNLADYLVPVNADIGKVE